MMVKEVESHLKAHFRDPSELISIIYFLLTFKFACDTNRLPNETAMWVLPFIVEIKPPLTSNSAILATAHIAPEPAFVQLAEPLRQ